MKFRVKSDLPHRVCNQSSDNIKILGTYWIEDRMNYNCFVILDWTHIHFCFVLQWHAFQHLVLTSCSCNQSFFKKSLVHDNVINYFLKWRLLFPVWGETVCLERHVANIKFLSVKGIWYIWYVLLNIFTWNSNPWIMILDSRWTIIDVLIKSYF